MKRRFSILGVHATEIQHIPKDEMNVMCSIHENTVGIPVFYSDDGRYFPLPMEKIIIVQDVYGF